MVKKILVIGQGFLGEYIAKTAIKLGHDTIGTHYVGPSQLTLDISNFNQVESLIRKINPDYVINSAARTDIDFLETHQDIAMQVNCIGAGNIAKICHENKIRLLHVSTDSVFDGNKGNYSEDDKPNPINVYAKSKHKGELEVSKYSKNHVIVRTNFYGINHRGAYFFNWILTSLKSKSSIIGYTDIIFSPLDVTTLSEMIMELFDIKHTGILHLSSGKPISKFDFIIQVAKQLNKSTDIIKPGKSDDTKVPRPKNTSLRNDLAKKLLRTQVLDLSMWIQQNQSDINKYLK